jgi:hypothetical protein
MRPYIKELKIKGVAEPVTVICSAIFNPNSDSDKTLKVVFTSNPSFHINEHHHVTIDVRDASGIARKGIQKAHLGGQLRHFMTSRLRRGDGITALDEKGERFTLIMPVSLRGEFERYMGHTFDARSLEILNGSLDALACSLNAAAAKYEQDLSNAEAGLLQNLDFDRNAGGGGDGAAADPEGSRVVPSFAAEAAGHPFDAVIQTVAANAAGGGAAARSTVHKRASSAGASMWAEMGGKLSAKAGRPSHRRGASDNREYKPDLAERLKPSSSVCGIQ